uniref:Uncharacterized protein n=1 Tax=Arundo donax TaxID=35708 RepID=A0A0A9EUD9_ARUDO
MHFSSESGTRCVATGACGCWPNLDPRVRLSSQWREGDLAGPACGRREGGAAAGRGFAGGAAGGPTQGEGRQLLLRRMRRREVPAMLRLLWGIFSFGLPQTSRCGGELQLLASEFPRDVLLPCNQ